MSLQNKNRLIFRIEESQIFIERKNFEILRIFAEHAVNKRNKESNCRGQTRGH